MAVLPGRTGDDRFTGEQEPLRRVATLVTRGAPPDEVLTAVTEEAGRLLGADYTTMARYGPDGTITAVASWSTTGAAFPVGTWTRLGGRNVPTLVFQTHQPGRIDDYAGASGPAAEAVREFGFRAAVGVPVCVEGRLWGVMIVDSRAGPLPAGTEGRLAGFTELAATAIANAQARVELRGFADEQAALRRVATLVAHAAPPEEVLTAVAEEAGRPLHADYATMGRYAAKHARATTADIQVTASNRVLHLRIRDNGRGGADFSHGSGLLGLKDRTEALGGHLQLHSPPGAGTTLEITLPLNDLTEKGLPPEGAGLSDDASRGPAAEWRA